MEALRGVMERQVGVVREAQGLAEAVRHLAPAARDGSDAALTGLAIAVSALSRRESRGAHWRSDYPGQQAPGHTEITLADLWTQAETASPERDVIAA